MAGLSEGCRFRGCTHLHEPECAVSQAVEEGRIAASRFQSYRAMAGELGDR
jgi:ribosome biogenesis GTPase